MKMYIRIDKNNISIHIGSLVSCEASRINENSNFYFNRIKIKEAYRNKGIGTKVLNMFLDIFDILDKDLELEINPYGSMTRNNLEKFYISYGFEKIDSNFYIRNPKNSKFESLEKFLEFNKLKNIDNNLYVGEFEELNNNLYSRKY